MFVPAAAAATATAVAGPLESIDAVDRGKRCVTQGRTIAARTGSNRCAAPDAPADSSAGRNHMPGISQH